MENTARIGLGTFPFSNVFGEITEKDAEKIVRTFFDLGGKYIQTAPYYKRVDPLMGKILRNVPREKYYFSTLCAKNRQGVRTGKYKAIIEQCDDSLQHLGIEYIDLYMTSTTKSDVPFSETVAAMNDLQKQGKIIDIGVCNVTLEQLKEYNKNGTVQYVQNRYSLICQKISDRFVEYCKSHHIGIIPYNVIEHGLLTNKILKKFELREKDLRRSVAHFREEVVQAIQHWVIAQVEPLAKSMDTSIEALAIFWALQQPEVNKVVVGATKTEPIISSLTVIKKASSGEIVQKLNNAYEVLIKDIMDTYSKDVNEFIGNVY